jgi:hypothetical protein
MWRKFNDAQYHLQIVWRHGDSERLDAVVDVRRLIRKFLRIMEVVALNVESGPERFVWVHASLVVLNNLSMVSQNDLWAGSMDWT